MLLAFGANGLGFHFGLTPGAWEFHWAYLLFGPGKWAYAPIFQTLSIYILHVKLNLRKLFFNFFCLFTFPVSNGLIRFSHFKQNHKFFYFSHFKKVVYIYS